MYPQADTSALLPSLHPPFSRGYVSVPRYPPSLRTWPTKPLVGRTQWIVTTFHSRQGLGILGFAPLERLATPVSEGFAEVSRFPFFSGSFLGVSQLSVPFHVYNIRLFPLEVNNKKGPKPLFFFFIDAPRSAASSSASNYPFPPEILFVRRILLLLHTNESFLPHCIDIHRILPFDKSLFRLFHSNEFLDFVNSEYLSPCHNQELREIGALHLQSLHFFIILSL